MKIKGRTKKLMITGLVAVLLFFLVPVPDPLFSDPYSTILEADGGELLAAKIADDGQWRFPQTNQVPDKFSQCILQFEDEYFYYHPGVNPVSIARAIKQNVSAGKVVSGGSTLSMQLARMSRKGKSRNLWQKAIELIWALRLEVRYSKEEILALYASHAPFGGNVVGVEAAAWRYFRRSPTQLSWSESAMLAVLPNAPSLLFPGKNQDALKEKRNRLLDKLFENNIIDATTLDLAKSEPLVGKPYQLPQEAIHLLNRALTEGKKGQRLETTLRAGLQKRVNEIVESNYLQLRQNEIHNLSVLVIDNKNNEVISYVGNTRGRQNNNGHRVDVITANRSTGSLLKPFLYGLAWQDGLILPQSLLADIPTQYGGYAPKNFNKKFEGAARASEALIHSLNVPAVRLLKNYGVERFYDELSQFPFPTINKGASHYGLSIILGGAESTLWEMCTAYKGMSESLRNLQSREYKYYQSDYDFPWWLKQNNPERSEKEFNQPPIKGAAIWQLAESLQNVNRPGQEEGWESFVGRRKIAWKTGTSFGLRDAWAIGIYPEYTIGVWVGNADGEGRPGLTGINVAAPILFEVFQQLPESSWYETPYDELYELEVCSKSGYSKGLNCPETELIQISHGGQNVKTCPYHELVQLNREKTKRVNSSCYPVAQMEQEHYLVLPPLMQWYYRKKEPTYKLLPPWKEGCEIENENPMQLITPVEADKVLIPVNLEGVKGSLVVEVAHKVPYSVIHWHLDNEYLGATEGTHQKEITPTTGKHILVLVDEKGNSIRKEIEIVK